MALHAWPDDFRPPEIPLLLQPAWPLTGVIRALRARNPGLSAPGSKKVEKGSKKGWKSRKNGYFLTRFCPFFRLFFNLFWPRGQEAPGTFFDFFGISRARMTPVSGQGGPNPSRAFRPLLCSCGSCSCLLEIRQGNLQLPLQLLLLLFKVIQTGLECAAPATLRRTAQPPPLRLCWVRAASGPFLENNWFALKMGLRWVFVSLLTCVQKWVWGPKVSQKASKPTHASTYRAHTKGVMQPHAS